MWLGSGERARLLKEEWIWRYRSWIGAGHGDSTSEAHVSQLDDKTLQLGDTSSVTTL